MAKKHRSDKGVPRADLTGQAFGELTVLEFAYTRPGLSSYWLCQCSCGETKVARSADLKKGSIASCGCKKRKRLREQAATHGLSHLAIYRRWCGIIQRCSDPSHVAYSRYGGKGITVCNRWKSFENFYEDMGDPPDPSCSIERKDSSSGYSPENCCWATAAEQNRNTSQNHMIAFNGKTQCLADWANELGMKYETLSSRISRYNWPIEKALTTPVRTRRQNQYS